MFIWASVVDLYNRLKPGLSLAELSGEEEGGWITLDLNYLDHVHFIMYDIKHINASHLFLRHFGRKRIITYRVSMLVGW